jgi:hypothetical protein
MARRVPGGAVLSLVVLAIAGYGAAPAFSTPLPPPVPPTTPLPGSSFQGADGNQNGLGATDWQGLEAADRVQHSPDSGGSFQSGKMLEPGEWDLAEGEQTLSPKNDILDAWSAVDEVGANTFLYLAFTRVFDNGTEPRAIS